MHVGEEHLLTEVTSIPASPSPSVHWSIPNRRRSFVGGKVSGERHHRRPPQRIRPPSPTSPTTASAPNASCRPQRPPPPTLLGATTSPAPACPPSVLPDNHQSSAVSRLRLRRASIAGSDLFSLVFSQVSQIIFLLIQIYLLFQPSSPPSLWWNPTRRYFADIIFASIVNTSVSARQNLQTLISPNQAR